MPSPRFNHGYENDVFISYCRNDDEADVSGRQWVTRFEHDLKMMLEQNSGRRVRIWRDQKLNAADIFDNEIFDQLRKSAVFVPILTRAYFNSQYCGKEWSEFLSCNALSADVGNISRMVKVAKMYVPFEDYPPELMQTNQHSFFVQEGDGKYRQYHLHPDPRYEREYATHVDDVAQELDRLLTRMENATRSVSSKGSVFVGETSSDLNPDRDRICRALQQLDYDILPKTRLQGLTAPAIREAIALELENAKLAILPVGAYYGVIPEMGGDSSIVKIQIEVAAQDSRNGGFPRLIWIPKDVHPREPRQEQLIREVEEVWARRPFEVLQVLPHQLEEVLEVRLAPPPPAAQPSAGMSFGQDDRPSVYVLCEPQDVEAALPLRQWLFDNDFDVPGPPDDWTDPAALREELRRRFTEDHAFLIYYGRTNESWVRAQLKDISKAAGLDRKEPILGRAVVLADPETPNKRNPMIRETLVRAFAADPLDAALSPFAAELRKRWSGRGQTAGSL